MFNATKKLYDEDAYLKKFEATVLSCEECADGFAVVLDRTAFFPESGGQTADTGVLEGVRVTDVRIDEKSDVITHIVEDPLEAGACVVGKPDWEHRFDNMQQHTGEHIFSGIVCSRFKCNNVGFHLGLDTMTMDYDRPLAGEELLEVEAAANRAIWSNIPVDARYPTSEELDSLHYRSKKALTGAVRIVTIEGVDVCACCAPHVKRTGEVGIFKLWSVQSYKGGVRVKAFCGERAFKLLSREHDILNKMARDLSTVAEEVPSSFEKLRLTLSLSKRRESELAGRLVQAALKTETCIFEHDADINAMRRALDAWIDDGEGLRFVFVGDDDAGYRFIAGRGRKSSGAVPGIADVTDDMKIKLGAKGGGSPEMFQGSVKAEVLDIRRVIEEYT